MKGFLREWDSLKLEYLWPNADRLKVAFFLSEDVKTCEDLLLGQYVDPVRLDAEWLRWARREQFVALKPALETL